MIIGIVASQPLPHRWSATSPLGGRGLLTSGLKFGIGNISARLSGTGQAMLERLGIPYLQASALFAGRGSMVDLVGPNDPYTASAVHFNGSTWLQRHAWLDGVGDFNRAIFSVWTKLSNSVDGLFYA